MSLITIIVGVIAGSTIAIQSTFSAVLSRSIGFWATAFVIHIVGTLAALVPLWIYRSQANWQGWNTAPWYVYLGGILGVIIIFSVAYTIAHSNVTAGVSIIIASQLVVALLIDQFGLFGMNPKPMDWIKFTGIIFLFVGARLVLR